MVTSEIEQLLEEGSQSMRHLRSHLRDEEDETNPNPNPETNPNPNPNLNYRTKRRRRQRCLPLRRRAVELQRR